MSSGLIYLIRRYRPLKGRAALWVYGALALGIAAMVMLFRFSYRVEATVNKDARKFLAADFQIRARRAPTSEVLEAAQAMAGGNSTGLALQTDLLASAKLPSGDSLTISLRALENDAYPFYGTFRVAPQFVPMEQLAQNGIYGVLVDASLRERGLKLGDLVGLGSITASVMGFIEEEPQSVASAFAMGPRFVIHQRALTASGLNSYGAYSYYSLLVRSPLKLTEAQKVFREHVSEPHWRIVSPERANQQTQRVVSRLQSFLMLIAFAAFVLGGVGLFAIARFQILRNIGDWILFKALGLSRRELLLFSAFWVLMVALVALTFGFGVGWLLEENLTRFAMRALSVELSGISWFTALWQAGALSIGASLLALGLPLWQVTRVSPNQAWSTSRNKTMDAGKRSEWWLLGGGSALVIGLATTDLISKSWLVALVWAVAMWIGAAGVKHLSGVVSRRQGTVLRAYPFLWVQRAWPELRVLNYSIASAIYLMVLVAVVSSTLRGQLQTGRADSAPAAVMLGVLSDQKDMIQLPAGVTAKWVPTLQLRILSIKGVVVKSIEFDDEGERVESEDSPRSAFSLTREYMVSPRAELESNETLISATLPGFLYAQAPVEIGGIRLSLGSELAERLEVGVGDTLTVSVAGVELPARVDSIRRVQWFRFQPSFEMLASPEDLVGAPISYVGLVPEVKDLPALQRSLQKEFSNVAVIDARSLAEKLTVLVDRVILAVSLLGIFVVVAATWVFVAVVASRREAFRQDLYMIRILGLEGERLRWLALRHFTFLTFATAGVSALLGVASAWLVCGWLLEIPLDWNMAGLALVGTAMVATLFTMIGFLISGPYDQWRYESH